MEFLHSSGCFRVTIDFPWVNLVIHFALDLDSLYFLFGCFGYDWICFDLNCRRLMANLSFFVINCFQNQGIFAFSMVVAVVCFWFHERPQEAFWWT